jgi:hypothetical protein
MVTLLQCKESVAKNAAIAPVPVAKAVAKGAPAPPLDIETAGLAAPARPDAEEEVEVPSSSTMMIQLQNVRQAKDGLECGPTDEYGFFANAETQNMIWRRARRRSSGQNHRLHLHKTTRAQRRQQEARQVKITKKWQRVTQRWQTGGYDTAASGSRVEQRRSKAYAQLKALVRQGIPNCLRGSVWMLIASATNMKENHPNIYNQVLLRQREERQQQQEGEQQDFLEVIDCDLHRTYPDHATFSSEAGQKMLRRVLRSYSIYDTEVGYCQGMNFITALFLCTVPEEDAFWLLASMIRSDRHKYAGVLKPGMPQAIKFFYTLEKLIAIHLPKLSTHFAQEGVEAPLYAARWVVTCFTCFNFEIALRVFDTFLLEGWKVIYRVALALLTLSERELLQMQFEQIVEYLQHQLKERIDEEPLMTAAFKIPLKTADIEKFELEAHQLEQQKQKERADRVAAYAAARSPQ